MDKELTDMMSQSAKSIVGDEGGMYLADDDGKRIYANSCNYKQKDIKVKDGTLTLIVGYLGTVVGLELLGNWDEFGLLIAIAVMGAFIIYFNDKKK